MSTKQILNLINRQPFAFSESHQTDIVCEFNTLLIEIKSVCHRLDKCRKAIQFAQTKETIGKDLIHIIHFIINRYYCDPLYGNSFISLIGLLMVALQVLDTEDEVQRQLMDENHIGRIIMMQMSAVLELVKSTYTYYLSIDSQIELFKIALDYQFEREDINHIWFPVLKETCLLLTRRDPNWDCKGEYDNICSMATSLLFD
ncbi:uncharacterized protein B0P05DRAFT_476111 [Gilbertella persicaria]|uniref:uncharacterized protein n=1 Tax=Gilbertella persicaria TaxID=101096 RepID=UPI00221F5293|nr:uncharacterized protein B0P05DRAFT_476111 [Gilbertella persicaria]KAI8065353.1 hypothetical protein B0P05DRAFT_476111 [Gilbertella persicaria]